MRKETIRFKVDEPVTVRFNFSQPIEKEGKYDYGPQFYYGVKWEGQDAGFYASEALHKMLQAEGNLRGKVLEIEKKETDNGKFYWLIRKNGEDITDVLKNSGQEKTEQSERDDSRLDDIETRLSRIETRLYG